MTTDTPDNRPANFIRTIIDTDLANNKNAGRVVTRFPPEPNGYLHIGHAKSICLNFGLAHDYNGICHLRFDDTNPIKEEQEYIDSIKKDVEWLGFAWDDKLFFTSDYFAELYNYAVKLIKMDKAYICSLSADEMRSYRGTLTEPGKKSPNRKRPMAESLDLFERMRAGEFKEGEYVLRAKIDMASGNLNMRDPIIYRVMHADHHRTSNSWCVYPMYDFAHCLSDAMESITHSICTLEFEDHRPLYDWILDTLATPSHPQQIEFARLNLDFTVMSKRKLMELVKEGLVSGWDDPRMLTISGLRRRGFTPTAIRNFCEIIGVGKRESRIEMGVLENCLRDDLNETAPRVMGVLKPLKLIIDNYPAEQVEDMEAKNHPQKPEMGTRTVPFSKELYVEETDFMEDPPRKFFRLGPGREVRLRYGYLVTCDSFIKDENGKVTEIHCTYDPESKGGNAPDGRKVKGTIHWVSAAHAIRAKINLYDRLFKVENPEGDKEIDFKEHLNPESLTTLDNCMLEPSLAELAPGTSCQLERTGYFCLDSKESSADNLVLNRTVTLRDSWAKARKKGK